MRVKSILPLALIILVCLSCRESWKTLDIPLNTWTQIVRDEKGARRHSSFTTILTIHRKRARSMIWWHLTRVSAAG